ncbi:MAG: organic solvent tolerance protein [Deltaproteobacteria bacterium]|nr:organic solvent tolerance protein [Deltaproteobacteria bacterium]
MNQVTGVRILTFLGALILIGLVSFVALPQNAEAKDLSNRLGLGFKNQSSTELPGIAVQYWPGADLGLSASLGIDTQTNNSKFGAMLKLYRVIFPEDNLNFYLGAGAGILSLETAGNNESGFELMGFAGVEAFLAGLENVGFNFEFGTAITSISSGTRFRTLGDSPVRAGVTFYF